MKQIYVNYWPQNPTDELLDDVKKFSDILDSSLKNECLQKFKALYGATYDAYYSPINSLYNIRTDSYRGFSRCRYSGVACGSMEWNILHNETGYVVPEGVIHYMEEHGVYPVLLSDGNDMNYSLSDQFFNLFVNEIEIK